MYIDFNMYFYVYQIGIYDFFTKKITFIDIPRCFISLFSISPRTCSLIRDCLYSKELKSVLEIDVSELPQQLLGTSDEDLRNTYLKTLGVKLEQWVKNLVKAEANVSDDE